MYGTARNNGYKESIINRLIMIKNNKKKVSLIYNFG